MSGEHWNRIKLGLKEALDNRKRDEEERERKHQLKLEQERAEREREEEERVKRERLLEDQIKAYEQALLEKVDKPFEALRQIFEEIADNSSEVQSSRERNITTFTVGGEFTDKHSGYKYPKFKYLILRWGDKTPSQKKRDPFGRQGRDYTRYSVHYGIVLPPKKHKISGSNSWGKLLRGRKLESYACIGARFDYESNRIYVSPQDFEHHTDWSSYRAYRDKDSDEFPFSESGFNVDITAFTLKPAIIIPRLTQVLADSLSHRFDYSKFALLYSKTSYPDSPEPDVGWIGY